MPVRLTLGGACGQTNRGLICWVDLPNMLIFFAGERMELCARPKVSE